MANKSIEASPITIENFDYICRLCLVKFAVSVDIQYSVGNFKLSELYWSCCSIEVKSDDMMPQNICESCKNKLINYHEFKMKCQLSDAVLHSVLLMNQNMEAKDEFPIYEIASVNNELIEEEILIIDERDEDIDSNEYEMIEHVITTCSDEESTDDNNTISPVVKKIISKQNEVMIIEQAIPVNPVFKPKNGKGDTDSATSTVRRNKCSICNINFNTYSSYLNHRRNFKHPIDRKVQKCLICHQSFDYANLKNHLCKNTGERLYDCDACGAKFRIRSNFIRHLKQHTGEKPHVCNVCGKGFIQSNSLKVHMQSHGGEDHFMCHYCGQTYPSSESCREHIQQHIQENSENVSDYLPGFKCSICNKILATKVTLNLHTASHYENSYLCSECGKSFSRKAYLDIHFKVHTGERPFRCKTCGKAFSQRSSLKTHSLIHTGEKPHKCILCGKTFKQKQHLRYHMNSHTGDKPYTCSYCKKCFTHAGTVKVHERIHTGEKPYICDICKKGFYDSSSMKKHRQRHKGKDVDEDNS